MDTPPLTVTPCAPLNTDPPVTPCLVCPTLPDATPNKDYVLGFIFSPDLTQVALIQKNHPEWQAGLFNGVGGLINPSEGAANAMVRECKEECGLDTHPEQWRRFISFGKLGDWRVNGFVIATDITLITSPTDEKMHIFDMPRFYGETLLVDNLHWLVAMAKNYLTAHNLKFTCVEYDA